MKRTLDDLAGDLNVFLTRHEDQNIARRERKMNLEDLLDRAIDIVFARGLGVEDLNRERPSRDGESRRIAIERRELRIHERGSSKYGRANVPSQRSW